MLKIKLLIHKLAKERLDPTKSFQGQDQKELMRICEIVITGIAFNGSKIHLLFLERHQRNILFCKTMRIIAWFGTCWSVSWSIHQSQHVEKMLKKKQRRWKKSWHALVATQINSCPKTSFKFLSVWLSPVWLYWSVKLPQTEKWVDASHCVIHCVIHLSKYNI